MPDIAIFHPSLNFGGGAEKVCLSVIKAIKEEGYNVTTITIDKTDWDKLANRFGEVVLPDREQVASNYHVQELKASFAKASYEGLNFLYYLHEKLKGYDLVINTYGDFELLNMFADIVLSGLPFSMSYMFPDNAPYPMNNKFIQNAYYIASKSMTLFTLKRKPLLLTYSTFTQEVLRKFYGTSVKIDVLHPPCDVRQYLPSIGSQDRQNLVVTVSRFSRGKRLEIIPYIAKHAANWHFVIAGSTSEASKETIERVRNGIRHLDVEDRVELVLNAPRGEVLDIIGKAKVYLHLMMNEPFGMSIVEAMGFGCVPVIHQSGGAWYDVLKKQQGYYGYGYARYMEAVGYIKMLEDRNLYSALSKEARIRASSFNEDLFGKKFITSLRKVLGSKNSP